MKMNFFRFHSYFLQVFLNLIPIFWINIFYDNQTYIEFTLHHYLYVIAWITSTVFGFYFYSKKIWSALHIPYSSIIHSLLCIGLLSVAFIPYGNQYNSIINRLHVNMITICFIGFLFEWVIKKDYFSKKEQIKGLVVFLFCILTVFIIGHVSCFTEICVSLLFNFSLFNFYKKTRVL